MKIQYNAPVVLTFTFISAAVLLLKEFGIDLTYFFSVGGQMNFLDPVDYMRLFTHVIGHANVEHFVNNFTFILLLGPILEEKYGSKRLFTMLALTALITGVLNIVMFDTSLLGASGVVFMFIILSSVVNVQKGHIPLTFILIAIIFFGQEIFNVFANDNISQFAHILGGICGSLFGFAFSKKNNSEIPPSIESENLFMQE
ncbi:rhomboid family intramembrane serine protease [Sediminitomix flava]|uniref:Rhomboid family protein n=1 Tax=Sediminitomix flava TaxID=379075 RepID=A0A315Z7N2_SEDFL|nr:rhomboid family intramembrane serine protease [Sediminitomix flava]PWJ39415.1 rhomboid family protein [Sediminitomix flava]